MRIKEGAWHLVIALSIAIALPTSSNAANSTRLHPGHALAHPCAQLSGMSIPASAIGLPTSGATVVSATVVPRSEASGSALPEYCIVSGRIAPVDSSAPDIRFSLALPTQWNAKALMLGGGGLDGSVPNVAGNVSAGPKDRPVPLARGYATFGSDSGHQAGALDSLDGAFGMNDEALSNWNSGDALKKTRDAAMYVIGARYGRTPMKSYFAGGSTGGREALTVIQRWPRDWDGAIALYPARAEMVSILGGQRMNRALAQPGELGRAFRIPT